jgi:hypothetical protein
MPNGTIRQFRYIAEIGEAGFIVSPIITSARDFLSLELPAPSPYFEDSRPVSMSISVVGGKFARALWRKHMSIQFSKLTIPVQQSAVALLAEVDQPWSVEPAKAQPEQIMVTNDCSIDSINGQMPNRNSLAVKGHLHVQGWAAPSINDGIAPEVTKIILTGPDAANHALIAKITHRYDVNKYFNRPDLADLGFDASADVSNFDGRYKLSVEVYANGEWRECATHSELSIASMKSLNSR